MSGRLIHRSCLKIRRLVPAVKLEVRMQQAAVPSASFSLALARAVAVDGYAVHNPQAVIIIDGVVLGTAIVPEGD